MYSMVLMMAMSTSPDAAACHPKGCSGCTGVVVSGCSGCSGWSCMGSGCHGGGWSCFGSSCHGCRGGLFAGCGRKHGCSGYSCMGSSCYGSGCYGSGCIGSGCGGTPVAPPPAKDMPKEEPKPKVTSAPAYITINVPVDAKVTIDGAATVSTSAVRVFSTPNLSAGTVYYYTFAAEVVREGKTYTATEKVAVEAGANPVVTLNPNVGPAVASK